MKPLSELISKLNLPKPHKIPRGISKTNYLKMKQLQAENKKIVKQRKQILSKYKVGNSNDWDKDGYSKSPIYKFEGEYYN